MYQALNQDSESFCSNPSHTLDFHEHENANPPQKMEISLIVTADDSLYGLALKYNISVQTILHLNDLSSESIYPGQRLRLLINKSEMSPLTESIFPKKLSSFSGRTALESTIPWELENIIDLTIDELIQLEEEKIDFDFTLKIPCAYSTSKGDIIGDISIFKDLLTFQPDKNNIDNQMTIRNKNFERFFASIDLKDIVNTEILALKGEYYLQILLSSIGDCKNEIYVKKVKEYKALKKAMASAFFKLSKNEKLTPFLKDLSSISSRINSFIENQKKLLSQENPFSSTKIPFYDIVRHKDMSCIEKSPKISADIPIEKKPVPEEYLPRTTDISTILNKEKFHDLVNALPSVLRLCHWHLIYATMTHGTCFEVLFRLAGDYDYPNLLVIKDWKGNVFGAYFNEGWKRKKLFYGAGETFLYTFKTGDDLKVFSWTKRNNYFLLTNGENGICIGAGDYFGLYIHPDLTKGYSYPCETFDNDFLTDNKDFWIERLEIWMVDYYE